MTTKVLDYQRVSPGAPARRARAFRIAMLIVAILAVHLAAILILHPAFEMSEVQTYLGGGVIGTPFSPINVPVPDGGHGRYGSDDRRVLEQYLPRGCAYLALLLLSLWWVRSQ